MLHKTKSVLYIRHRILITVKKEDYEINNAIPTPNARIVSNIINYKLAANCDKL